MFCIPFLGRSRKLCRENILFSTRPAQPTGTKDTLSGLGIASLDIKNFLESLGGKVLTHMLVDLLLSMSVEISLPCKGHQKGIISGQDVPGARTHKRQQKLMSLLGGSDHAFTVAFICYNR